MSTQWKNSRNISKRIFVEGELILKTPAGFGNGDNEATTDIPLLLDEYEQRPLLTGASISGALRNYLREFFSGYGHEESGIGTGIYEALFGYVHQANAAAVESWLIVDDALGSYAEAIPSTEFRDGVTINPKTRTAEDRKKYDYELLSAGTSFHLSFELLLPEEKTDEFLQAFVIALNGLQNGEIGLGLRKNRGLGQCHVLEWKVVEYDMGTTTGLINWLDRSDTPQSVKDLSSYFNIQPSLEHKGERFTINSTFEINKAIMIRAASFDADDPDVVHLRSWRNNEEAPIISGTSLAGALRARANRIAKTLLAESDAQDLVDSIFGYQNREQEGVDDKPTGSRLIVHESVIEKDRSIHDRIQNRVKIDRFTGGSYPSALFNQQPLFAKANGETQVTLSLELRKYEGTKDSEFQKQIGLLLLVLKDLWTSDLPLGGESSIGRGRLKGIKAELTHYAGQGSDVMNWKFWQQADGTLDFKGDIEKLNDFSWEKMI